MKFKNIIHRSLLMGFALVALTSCKKDFLEVIPKGKLIPQSTEDFNLLMNNTRYYYSHTGIWQPAMLMGDEVSAEIAKYSDMSYLYAGYMFQWRDNIFIPSTQLFSRNDRPEFLELCLSNIYSLNVIIDGVMDSKGGSEDQKKDIQGQALASRAYINFQLINYFAKPYLASSARTDPGFPIITTADARRTDFKRGTVQEAYNAIVADLKQSITQLKITPDFPTRMSRPAAEALLGKVYLFMGNYSEAGRYLDEAFTDINKMSKKPELYDYNIELGENGSFNPISPVNGPNSPFSNMTDLKESVVARISYAGTYIGMGYPNDFLSISPKTLALYDPKDLRLYLYTDKQRDMSPIPTQPNGPKRLHKYGLTYARIGIELSELYLLRAEARARLDNTQGAKSDLEYLRRHRMPSSSAGIPPQIISDKKALVSYIMQERIREFAVAGYRWFDMRRLSVDPLFAGISFDKHQLYDEEGKVKEEFELRTERLTLRIPKPYLDAHPEMVNNP